MLAFLDQSCGEQLWTAGILFCVTDSGDSLSATKAQCSMVPAVPCRFAFHLYNPTGEAGPASVTVPTVTMPLNPLLCR